MPRGIFRSGIWTKTSSSKESLLLPRLIQTHQNIYLQVGDPGVTLASISVTIGGRGGGGGGQIIGRDAPRVPVRPVNAVCLDMQVHGVDAHVGITQEDLLIVPVGD